VCGGGVHYPWCLFAAGYDSVNQGNRFARGIVVETQDDGVRLGQQGALGGRVFAQSGVDL